MEGRADSRRTKREKKRFATQENHNISPSEENIDELCGEKEVPTKKTKYNLRSDKTLPSVSCYLQNSKKPAVKEQKVKRKKIQWEFSNRTRTRTISEQTELTQVQQGETSSEKALLNPIILQNTLKYFSTGFLLSSCSLVCKTWNKVSRTFIRNHRKCTAKIPPRHRRSNVCQIVKILEGLFSQIVGHGRQVPFNGLKVNLSRNIERCPKDSGCTQVSHIDLPAEISLKYLDIRNIRTNWFNDDYEQVPDAIRALVHRHASEIQRMDVAGVGVLKALLGGQSVNFQKLQEIDISPSYPLDLAEQKEILRNMRLKSPNVKKIYVSDGTSLEIIPEEQYKLLANLTLFLEDVFKDGFLYREVVEQKPQLRHLTIYTSTEANDETQKHLRDFLTQLLDSCRESLEYCHLYSGGLHVLQLLAHNELKNLSDFTLVVDKGENLDQVWNALVSIGNHQKMPKLTGMKISFNFHSEQVVPWPRSLDGGIRNDFSSVSKLILDVKYITVQLEEIKAAFPHLTSLQLSSYLSERVPCQEFWELWPKLEELKVCVMTSTLRQNYDAEFSGIHEEEAKLLRRMDDEYLQKVHIVPSRPSLLTMSNLRKLEFKFYDCRSTQARSSARRGTFISKVTKLVAFRRLPPKDVSVPLSFQLDRDV